MSEHQETSPRGLAYTLLALLLLAGLSLVLRFAHLGGFSFPVALGIAAFKALLVVVFFMELLTEKATVRFAFLAGLTLFALMLTLIVADLLTRSVPPIRAAPGTAERYHG